MGLIPESVIDEILSRLDIVELVSSYIPLKRIGKSYKALCPFHHEKTPSFIVNHERQIFHCFGCGSGGNAIGFLMQYEGLSFPETIDILSKKTNVVIPKVTSGDKSAAGGIGLQLYKINEFASRYYFGQLSGHEGQARAALDYLIKRGISQETINKFKIGYALDKWDGLSSHLRAKGIPFSLIEKAGLVIPKDGGGYYDRFRSRIIIPIVDVKDRVIAFGARALDNSLPKYINSPETTVYSKSKILFGLNLAKEAIRRLDQAIIVEGYFDMIMPYQEEVSNVVASCGTSLTLEQVRLLKRYTRNVVMLYDSDEAGQIATLRSLDLLVEEDLNVKVAYLPGDCDPDSLIRKSGAEELRKLISEAQDVFDYKFCVLKAKYNFDSITDKVRIVSEILPAINRFSNAVLKSACLKRLAEELKIDESALRQELKKIKASPLATAYHNVTEIQQQPTFFSPERMVIKLALEEEGLIGMLKDTLSPLDFKDRCLGQIASRMLELFTEGKKIEPHRLVNHFSDKEIARVICELTTLDMPKLSDKNKVFSDCLKRIKGDRLKLRQEEVRQQIRQAEMHRDENRVRELLKEFQSLTKKGATSNVQG